MRKIGIDARSLAGGPSGVATYVSALLERIPYLDPVSGCAWLNNPLWNQVTPPLAHVRRGWAAYHAPAYTAPLVGCWPLVLAVHDVSYLASPEWYPHRLDAMRRRYYTASLRRADRIIVCSDFSRAEILRFHPDLEDRIRRIYLGVSPRFYPDPESATRTRAQLRLPGRFLLHVGDIHTRRNVPLLARVAQAVGLPLVLVGRPLPGGEQFVDWPLRFSGLDVDCLRGLYSAAAVFLYGSVYEGFGLPVLEAMACGAPVVAANASSIPEVCGQAAVLAPPDLDALVEGIREALAKADAFSRAGLARAAAFTWDRTARETEAVYREVAPDAGS
jgi:glycosyltransferase involved in cell wall biosynthesis